MVRGMYTVVTDISGCVKNEKEKEKAVYTVGRDGRTKE